MANNQHQNFSPHEEKQIIDILTNRPGFAGDTTRVLTEYYYNFCYTGNTTSDAIKLIKFRFGLYENMSTMDSRIDEVLIIDAVRENYDNIPYIILLFFYFENYHIYDQREFIHNNVGIIYEIVCNEYLKISEKRKLELLISVISAGRKLEPVISEISAFALSSELRLIEDEIEGR